MRVQAVFGKPDDENELRDPTYVDMRWVSSDGDNHWYTADATLDRQGSFGYTVRVLPKNDALASCAELALVVSA